MKSSPLRRVALLGGTALATVGAPAGAQPASSSDDGRTGPPSTILAAPPRDSAAVGDIIVTAQRRSESLQRVPASITAVSGTALEQQRITSFSAVPSLVPNLQTTTASGPGEVSYSLRGISLQGNPNQEGPIAVYFDEVYKGATPAQGIYLFDIDRVEVLRGPQGTLYGKNASGGAINFISRTPGQSTEGYIVAGAGNYGRVETEGAFQLGLGGGLAGRVAFTATKADGYVENLLPGRPDPQTTRNWGVRSWS